MNHINNFNQYLFENKFSEIFNDADILESIVTDTQRLLDSIEAEEISDIQSLFDIRDIKDNININELYENQDFNKRLDKMELKKSEIESTEENETFMKNTIQIKFFTIHKKTKSELEQPEYIIFQSKGKELDPLKAYKVNGDMKHFYNHLSSKTITITKNNKEYIYQTSNSGNDWELKNIIEDGDKIFTQFLDSPKIKDILDDTDITITINIQK